MIKIVENLKTCIFNSELIKNSVLGYTRHWKNNHYDLLSEIINDDLAYKIPKDSDEHYELGNTISAITLKRIFEGNIKPSAYNDLRFRKTLNKLAIFVNYKGINEFITEFESNNTDSNQDQDFEKAIDVIKDVCKFEYQQILNMPNFNITGLENLVKENSPYEERVKEYWNKLKTEGMRLRPGLHNYEVYDYQLVSKETDAMVVSSVEFWNLVFDTNNGIYTYHKERQQTYYFKKDNEGNWKIWDNYNPDLDELIRTRNLN